MFSRFADRNGWSYLDPAAQDNESLGCGFDVGHPDAQHVGPTTGIPQGVPASLLGHDWRLYQAVCGFQDLTPDGRTETKNRKLDASGVFCKSGNSQSRMSGLVPQKPACRILNSSWQNVGRASRH